MWETPKNFKSEEEYYSHWQSLELGSKLEQEFVEKFASFSKADEALSLTDAASKNVDEDIARLLKEKEKLNEMLALANKKFDDSEAKLKQLLDEKKEKKMKQLLDDYLVKNVPSTSKWSLNTDLHSSAQLNLWKIVSSVLK